MSDTAQIVDFSIATEGGVLKLSANIKQELDISKLAAIVPSMTAPQINERSKYKASRTKEKTENTGSYRIDREYAKTEKDFTVMKVHLRKWRKEGLLTTPELEFLGGYAGKFFSFMSEADKDSFLNMFNKVKAEIIAGSRKK